MRFALLCCLLFMEAVCAVEYDMNKLLHLTKSSTPPGMDATFDCEWRKLAIRYAMKIQPWLTTEQQQQIHDSLELATKCNQNFVGIPVISVSPQGPHGGDLTVFVDATKGSDRNNGTKNSPLSTIAAAVQLTRELRTGKSQKATIFLRSGTYYLPETVKLEAIDSGLNVAAFQGDNVVVSGGRPLEVTWTPAVTKRGVTVFQADLSKFDLPSGVPGLQINGSRVTRARYPNANPERDLFPAGYVTDQTSWLPPEYRGKVCNPSMQCGVSVNITTQTTDTWHGMYQNYEVGSGGACDVYDPPISPWCSGRFYLERQFPEMHTRHPAGITAGTNLLPNSPYATPSGAFVHAWRTGHWYTWMFEIASRSQSPDVNHWSIEQGQNNVFGIAKSKADTDAVKYLGTFSSHDACFAACNSTTKGKCDDWTWHQMDFGSPDWNGGCYMRVGGAWGPTAEDKVVSARGPHKGDTSYRFGAGGNQGGEGNDAAGEWFIENVEEELDAPNEFFYNEVTHVLSVSYNGTGAPPSEVVIPTLANFFELKGSQAQPVKDVSFSGITFTQGRTTFMEPRGNPSGGDWALERMGAIFLEGTEHVSISNNIFTKLDSNCIFLSGYNRQAEIRQNRFSWLGQNAVASWGKPQGNDGTNGEQPRGTTLYGNFVHEIGHYQKQSSFYFQAETALTNLTANIVFNIPRAAINFNDGFGGGNTITQNLLYNTCRESSDHGAFNSWDRLPYFTAVRNGTVSTRPAYNDVHHNYIVANYAADGGCLDNDDGSSYYDIHHNFCVFGGHKSDFDGNSKISRQNLHIYPQVYGPTCLNIGAQNLPPQGYAESYYNNTCVLQSAGSHYLQIGGIDGADCLDGSDKAKRIFEQGLVANGNKLYAPSGDAKVPHLCAVTCGATTISVSSFHKEGYDVHTQVITELPKPSTIIEWATDLLF